MRGPAAASVEDATRLWNKLPRATILGRREILDKMFYDEYQKGDIGYASLGELHGVTTSRVYSGIQRHRKLLKEGF